jgi:hypothetical protein
MTPEQRLLQQIREALAAADVDVGPLVDEAYSAAHAEVGDILRRLISQDLLLRTLETLGHRPSETLGPAPPSATGASASTGGTSADPAGTAPSAAGTSAAEPEPRPAGPSDPGRQTMAEPDRAPGAGTPPTRDGGPAAEEPGPGDASAVAGPPGAGAAGSAGETHATYVFGVTLPDDLDLDPLARLPGGGPLRTLDAGPVRAVVCDVDTATFEVLRSPGPEGLETLAAAAHAHDANLAALAGRTTVLPLPLGTVLPDDAVVIELLGAHGDRLRGELARFDGYAEWAVRVHVLDDPAADDEAARAADSGSEYLRRRSVALEAKQTRWRTREELATRMHRRLAAVAAQADVVVSRPLEDVAPPLLHGVYLLADPAVADLERTIAELREEHDDAVIEMTGPWPPYHFAAVELTPPGSLP